MAQKAPFFDVGPAISLELRQVLKNCELNLFLISCGTQLVRLKISIHHKEKVRFFVTGT